MVEKAIEIGDFAMSRPSVQECRGRIVDQDSQEGFFAHISNH